MKERQDRHRVAPSDEFAPAESQSGEIQDRAGSTNNFK